MPPAAGAAVRVRATLGGDFRSSGAPAGADGERSTAFAGERPAAGMTVDGWRGDNSHAIKVAKMTRATTPIGTFAGVRRRSPGVRRRFASVRGRFASVPGRFASVRGRFASVRGRIA